MYGINWLEIQEISTYQYMVVCVGDRYCAIPDLLPNVHWHEHRLYGPQSRNGI